MILRFYLMEYFVVSLGRFSTINFGFSGTGEFLEKLLKLILVIILNMGME